MIYDITLNNQTIAVELGHTISEWNEKYETDQDKWDISLDDVLTGALNADTDMVYWLIDGRLWETDDYIL